MKIVSILLAAQALISVSTPVLARDADDDDAVTAPGMVLTPLAIPGARLTRLGTLDGTPASPAITNPAAIATSPDGRVLAVLTSGFNGMALPGGAPDYAHSTERLMLFRVSATGAVKIAEAALPAAFGGLAWSADGTRIAATTGFVDGVALFRWDGKALVADGAPIVLGHKAGLGLRVKPAAAGVVWADRSRVLVANFFNDSVSLVDTARRTVVGEIDLRPGKIDARQRGVPGGTYPWRIVMAAPGRAVVSAPRDRELITLGLDGDALHVVARVTASGQPTALLAVGDGRVLATGDNADTLIALAADGRSVAEYPIPVAGDAQSALRPRGLNPNALAFGAEGRVLVTLGGINALASIDLRHTLAQPSGKAARVVGMAPTGWYPDAVAMLGGQLAVANFKGIPGPNAGACRNTLGTRRSDLGACRASGRYVLQLQTGSLLTAPLPADAQFVRLRAQVTRNLQLPSADQAQSAEAVMTALRGRIRNVIYIVKENRTYDQLLGDLRPGDGDAKLALFPGVMTPNHHALAREFVTFDRFFDAGEVSATGWSWSTQGRAVDLLERITPIGYAGKGLAYESEGTNRFVDVALSAADRHLANPDVPDDPDLLAGSANLTATDAPDGAAGAGSLWAAAMARGLTVRNYGFYGDLSRYGKEAGANRVPRERDPHATGLRVMWAADARLDPVTDPYYRSFDQGFPDYWLVEEWKRDWLPRAAAGATPRLTLLRIDHDHFGDFDDAIDGVNTPDRQMADNDYALGRIVEAVAHSPAAADTLIAVVEDDAQDGADHVDAHRSVVYLAGPGVRHGTVISTRYSTVNLIKTIERLLDLPALGLNDSIALPMAQAFDPASVNMAWTYTAKWPQPLDATDLPKPPLRQAMTRPASVLPERPAQWWAAAMAGQDFSGEDRLDTVKFNAALWRGIKGSPRPARNARPGSDSER
jgi:DNA-binding beta-propeller fold protein YncE